MFRSVALALLAVMVLDGAAEVVGERLELLKEKTMTVKVITAHTHTHART